MAGKTKLRAAARSRKVVQDAGGSSDPTGVEGAARMLGGGAETIRQMRLAVIEGLPKEAVRRVARAVTSDRRVQREVIHRIVPEATFKRRRERLSTAESEKAERLARVAAIAFRVWGEKDGRLFLATPHDLLGGETPIEAAVTDLGAREVEAILRAIEFGLPA